MAGMSPPLAALVASQHRIDAVPGLMPIDTGIASKVRRRFAGSSDSFAARLRPSRQWPMRHFVHIFGGARCMPPTESVFVVILVPKRATAALNDLGQCFYHVESPRSAINWSEIICADLEFGQDRPKSRRRVPVSKLRLLGAAASRRLKPLVRPSAPRFGLQPPQDNSRRHRDKA